MKKLLLPLLLLLLLLPACRARTTGRIVTPGDLMPLPIASSGDLQAQSAVFSLLAPGSGSNPAGAEALAKWLLSDPGRELAALYAERQAADERLLPYGDSPLYAGDIDSGPEEETIRLGVAAEVAETGLPDYALPVFEATVGYTVELTVLTDEEALALNRASGFDLLLLSRETWEALSIDLAPRSFDGLEGGLFPCLVAP